MKSNKKDTPTAISHDDLVLSCCVEPGGAWTSYHHIERRVPQV